jgi:hypothetical protein
VDRLAGWWGVQVTSLSGSKLARLERLQRLRASGALNEEEFESEKSGLLAQRRFHWWIAGGVLTAAIAATAAALFGFQTTRLQTDAHTISPKAETSELPSSLAAPSSAGEKTIRDRPIREQMMAAFKTAFGRLPPAKVKTSDAVRIFRPTRLIWLADRAVLLSEGTNVSDCHACTGALAIHYLAAAGQQFSLTGSWPDLVQGAGWGSPPKWKISEKLASNPAIVDEGGFTAQGCTSGGLMITELRPERPVQSGLVRTIMSNDSGYGEADQIEGHIKNIQRGHSFDVAYTGTRNFTEHWLYRGDRFVLQGGPTKMPQC